jgi:hypothetical protein
MSIALRQTDQFIGADGKPIVNGYVYIGSYNQDPVANPLSLFSDAGLAVPIANPQRTDSYGRPVNDIYVAEQQYSYQIKDSALVTIEGPNNRSASASANATVLKVENMTVLEDLTGLPDGARLAVAGYYSTAVDLVPDGGGGDFIYRAGSGATVDNILVRAATGMGVGRFHRVWDGNEINVKWAGARGNGAANDYAASAAATALLKARGNGIVYYPTGVYNVHPAIPLTEVKGVGMRGDGPDNTKIVATGGQPAVQCNGIWRSFFDGIMFTTTAALAGKAVFELDGNYDGVHAQGVQGNVFRNCYFIGAQLAGYAFAITRQGLGNGQGSENLFLGCNFDSGLEANFLISGTNALQNTLVGGNFQSHSKTGLKIAAGNANLFSVGFQSTFGYTQIVNGGYDIDNSTFSTGDRMIVDSCRTESLRFYKGGGSPANIRGLAHVPSTGSWGQGAKALNDLAVGVTAAGKRRIYIVTTAGITAGAEPVWPESGVVADGTVVWTELDFAVVENLGFGSEVNLAQIFYGQVSGNGAHFTGCLFTRDDVIFGEGPISNPGPLFLGCQGRAFPSNTPFPFTIGNNAAAGARSAATSMFNLAEHAIVFTEGVGGGTFYDVGIARGQGSFGNKAENTVKVTGGVELTTVTFAQLTAGVNNGVLYYCSDANPGTNPATGGGAGAFVVRQNGVWRAL